MVDQGTSMNNENNKDGPNCILAHWHGDCSGSMQSMGNAPMDGADNFCREFRNLAKSDTNTSVHVSFYTFSAEGHLIFDGDGAKITDEQIQKCSDAMKPSSTTNLYDTTVEQAKIFLATINSTYDSLPRTVKDSKTIQEAIRATFMLFTDGADNMSRQYNKTDVKNIFAKLQNVGCAVVFAAANMDALSVGTEYGLNQNTCLQMGSDERAATNAIRTMTDATVHRSTQSTCDETDELFSATARLKSCDPSEAARYSKNVSIFPYDNGRM
jgi:hypothetical protein